MVTSNLISRGSASRTSARRRLIATVVYLLALASAAAGLCGCGLAAGVVSNAELTIYNGQHPQTTDALVAAFTQQTGIKVQVESNDEDTLAAQLEQEGSRSPADIYYTENSNWLALVDQEGLLEKVDPATLANIPVQDSAADHDWVGVTARVSCLIYNTREVKVADLPSSILDLAQPDWVGKVGVDSGETDFWPLVDSVFRSGGRTATINWLKRLDFNAGGNVHIPDNETLTNDVNAGVIAIGVINQYYYYRLMAEIGKQAMHSRIAFFAPRDPGYVEDVSGAAVLRSAKHKQAAQEFLRFMTSAQGQSVIAGSESFEYPLHPGVPASPELVPLDKLAPAHFTPAELGTGAVGEQLLEQAGLL
ncbi:MAG: extracellular solute-binding protein [Solirubrobacteraceae bacterium]